MQHRDRQSIVFVGYTGTGKTKGILRVIESHPEKKTVIYDIQNEPKYKAFPRLPSLDLVRKMKKGIYRYFDSNWQQVITDLKDHFSKGLLILEDSSKYLPANEFKPLYDMLVSKRHVHVDIVMTFHSLNRVPRYILENADTLVLFKTGDNLEHHLKKLPRFDMIRREFDRLEAHSNPYESSIIPLR